MKFEPFWGVWRQLLWSEWLLVTAARDMKKIEHFRKKSKNLWGREMHQKHRKKCFCGVLSITRYAGNPTFLVNPTSA